jgi:hypothetical protein
VAGTGRLERIAALTDLLTAVDGRRRGEPIEAAQWNTVVEVLRGVLEIDRAQESGLAQSLADSYAPIGHEHLGQVSLAWLDADLQNRLVTGSGGGPVSVLRNLTDVGARVNDLSTVVSTLTNHLETVQKRTDDTAVDELTRSSKLRTLETRFTGVEDLRALVTSIAAQVQDLGPQVQTVLDLRSQLTTAAGEPIDVRAVTAQVGTLDAGLTAATSGVDGATLRMRDLQLAILELQDVAGVGAGGLEQRLATLGAQLQTGLDTRLDSRLTASQQDLATLVDQRLAGLERKLDERLGGIVDEVTQRVLDQVVDRITEIVTAKVTDRLEGIVEAGLKRRLAELNKMVLTLQERVARLEAKVFG